MSDRYRILIRILGALAWIFLLAGCTVLYYAKETEFWVVDAETGQPLEDVIVVAYWEIREGGWAGSIPIDQLEIMETLSDQNGRVYFPSYGPRIHLSGRMEDESPGLLLFKPGYLPYAIENEYGGVGQMLSIIRSSEWSGKQLKLTRVEDAIRYSHALRTFSGTVYSVIAFEGCAWKSMYRTIYTLLKEKKKLEEAGIETIVLSTARLSNCKTDNRSPEELWKDLTK